MGTENKQKINKALFLDRDGVINVNHGYVIDQDKFDWVPGIFQLVKLAKEKGFLVVVVTNQSGIGRGYYSEADFLKLSDWMRAEFKVQHADIDDVLYCPHHPSKAKAQYLKDCTCRKPKTGLVQIAAERYSISLGQSIMIGDKLTDIEMAIKAKIGYAYLLDNNLNQSLPSSSETTQVSIVTALEQIAFD